MKILFLYTNTHVFSLFNFASVTGIFIRWSLKKPNKTKCINILFLLESSFEQYLIDYLVLCYAAKGIIMVSLWHRYPHLMVFFCSFLVVFSLIVDIADQSSSVNASHAINLFV